MIITQRTIKHTGYAFPLVENVTVEGEPDPKLLQYGCKIAQKHVRKQGTTAHEDIYEWFNAPTRAAAFEFADANIDAWVEALKKAANKPKIQVAGVLPKLNGKG